VFPDDWNPHANAVRGTSGEQFRPWLKRSDATNVDVWSSMLLRALRFHNRDGDTMDAHGIELLVFVPRREFWENATVRPSNARYYQWGVRFFLLRFPVHVGGRQRCAHTLTRRQHGTQQPNGLVNASAVQSGAPIFVSLPHFLRCDPALLEAVDGLNPDPKKHELFLGVEEHTGMTFVEHQRIMISAKIEGRQGLWFPHVKDAYVPVAYFDQVRERCKGHGLTRALQVSDISPQGVKDFVRLYNGLSILYGAAALGLVGLALTLGLPPVYRFFKRHKRTPRNRLVSSTRTESVSEVVF